MYLRLASREEPSHDKEEEEEEVSQKGNEVPLESLMSLTLLLMTDSSRSMSMNNSLAIRKTLSASSD